MPSNTKVDAHLLAKTASPIRTLIEALLDDCPERRPKSAYDVANQLQHEIKSRLSPDSLELPKAATPPLTGLRRSWLIHSAGMGLNVLGCLALGRAIGNGEKTSSPRPFVPRLPPTHVLFSDWMPDARMLDRNAHVFQFDKKPSFIESDGSHDWTMVAPQHKNKSLSLETSAIQMPAGKFVSNLVTLFIMFNCPPNQANFELAASKEVQANWQFLLRGKNQYEGRHCRAFEVVLPQDFLENAEQISFQIRLSFTSDWDSISTPPISLLVKTETPPSGPVSLRLWDRLGD